MTLDNKKDKILEFSDDYFYSELDLGKIAENENSITSSSEAAGKKEGLVTSLQNMSREDISSGENKLSRVGRIHTIY